ncbi:hypothetical protein [Streptococcus sp. X13SY08]|uniref:hypothetical protein n=1 Tax=Streptococcus sp. X13SY08 TaxID=1676616 RepID=UPI00066FC9F9|nr:hypothetical protein [Streptococcus sp. X13SY08]
MKRNVLQGALLGLVFAILLSISSLAKADVAVYRLYNRQNGEHLYTTRLLKKEHPSIVFIIRDSKTTFTHQT